MTRWKHLVRDNRRGAFTLLELLVVIAIISVLLGLVFVAVQSARESANSLACRVNLKQIGLAAQSYHGIHGQLPPAFGFAPGESVENGSSGLGTVFFHLLPYIEQRGLYQASRYRSTDTPPQDFFLYTSGDVHQSVVAPYGCPSDPTFPSGGFNPTTGYAASSYAGNYLVFGVVDNKFASLRADGAARIPVSFLDGASQTLLFAEKYALASIGADDNFGRALQGGNHWAYFQADCNAPFFAYHYPDQGLTDPAGVGRGSPGEADQPGFQVRPSTDRCNPCLPATPHAAMNVCFADNSVRSLAGNLTRPNWWAYVTPAAGDRADD